MSNFESDGPSENEWDERGELAWNEFDWENYLREQDEVVVRYLVFYEKFKSRADRIDHVAHLMGWDQESWSSEEEETPAQRAESAGSSVSEDSPDRASAESTEYDDSEPYTLHKNPIFIATKAIYLSLKRGWERQAADPTKVPQAVALSVQTCLFRGEEQATLAIQALDFGDYAMAISLFKRALRELNQSFALLSDKKLEMTRIILAMREDMFPKLFDLREIWLRVVNECREELDRPSEDDDDDDD